MTKSKLMLIFLAVLCVGAVAAVADALVLTDEERLQGFVDAIDGEFTTESVDDALSFVQTDRVPLVVRTPMGQRTYDDRDAELAERAHDTVAELLGTGVDVIQSHIAIDGDEANVRIRVRTGSGVVGGSFEFEKQEDRWLMSQATIR